MSNSYLMSTVFGSRSGGNSVGAFMGSAVGSLIGGFLGGGVASAPILSPDQITGLTLWLDPSDTSTLWEDTARTIQATTTVARIDDKSGNNEVVQQTTGTAQPITGTKTVNGLNCLSLDGNDFFPMPTNVNGLINSGQYTFIAVHRCDVTTGTPAIFGALQGASGRMGIVYGTNYAVSYCSAVSSTGAKQWRTRDLNPHVIFGMRSGAEMSLVFDGQLRTNNDATNLTLLNSFSLGSFAGVNGLNGALGEVIVYNKKLSEAEVRGLGAWLANKWGVTFAYPTPQTTVAGFGDSITVGFNATDEAHRWIYLVNQAQNGFYFNLGISGTVLQNTPFNSTGLPQTNNGRDRYTVMLTNNKVDKVYILYGVNDIRNWSSGETNLTAALFENDLGEIVAGLIAGGYAASDITIGTVPYFIALDDAAQHTAYNAACLSVAETYHTKFADVYQDMVDNGGATLVAPDNIHPTNDGHAVIAAAMLAATVV